MGEQRADRGPDQGGERRDLRHRGLPLRRRPRRAPRLRQQEEEKGQEEGK